MVAGQRTQQESRVSTSEVRRLPSISRPADFALNLVLRAAYQVFKALFCFTKQDQLLLGNKLFFLLLHRDPLCHLKIFFL